MSMPQLTGMTSDTSIVASRKSAALRVGVVTARVEERVRSASPHAQRMTASVIRCGSTVKSRMFSAIT